MSFKSKLSQFSSWLGEIPRKQWVKSGISGLKKIGKLIIKTLKVAVIIIGAIALAIISAPLHGAKGPRTDSHVPTNGDVEPSPVANDTDDVSVNEESANESNSEQKDSLDLSSSSSHDDPSRTGNVALNDDEPKDPFASNVWLPQSDQEKPRFTLREEIDDYEQDKRYTLGIDYSSGLYPYSSPKANGNYLPEKSAESQSTLQSTNPELLSQMQTLDVYVFLNQSSLLRDSGRMKLEKDLNSRIISINRSEVDGDVNYAISFQDREGSSRLYLAKIEKNGETKSFMLDSGSPSFQTTVDGANTRTGNRSNGSGILDLAVLTSEEYNRRGVKYPDNPKTQGVDASRGGMYSDCSNFVHDIIVKAGYKAKYVTTGSISLSNDYEKVPQGEQRPGDIIVQRGQESGHMGIFTGRYYESGKRQGSPEGIQMGKGGARPGPWGPKGWFPNGGKTEYYRPKR